MKNYSFITFGPKQYFNKQYSQKITCYTDTGENEPETNTDTTYNRRTVDTYTFYFSSTGKTLKRAYSERVSIVRESAEKHNYIRDYSFDNEYEGIQAKDVYNRLMSYKSRKFEVTYNHKNIFTAVERNVDCCNAKFAREDFNELTIVF